MAASLFPAPLLPKPPMNDAHLHLLVNHVPILGTLFALLLGAYGAVRRQPAVVRASFLALVVCGAFAFVAEETGDDAEEVVEEIAGITHATIHEHEEAAEKAMWASLALALAALGVLVWRRSAPEIGTVPTVVVLLGAAAVFGLMAWTGNLGGEIRHTEINGASEARSAAPPRSDRRDRDD